MEILTVGEVMDRVAEVGGSLQLEGKHVALTLPPNCPPETEIAIVETIRANRVAVSAILHDMGSEAPPLEEVKASLPPGVKLVSYHPKQAPFAVAPVSVVKNAGKFYRAYLKDLGWRIEHPEGRAAPPLSDIVAKLAEAGLELTFQAAGAGSRRAEEDPPP
jgi:hypothetical protein